MGYGPKGSTQKAYGPQRINTEVMKIFYDICIRVGRYYDIIVYHDIEVSR